MLLSETPEKRKEYRDRYRDKPGMRSRMAQEKRRRYAEVPAVKKAAQERYANLTVDKIDQRRKYNRDAMRKKRLDPTLRAEINKKSKEYKRNKYTTAEGRILVLAQQARVRARRSGVCFEQDLGQSIIGSGIPDNCPCCGVMFDYYTVPPRSERNPSPSLDRLIPELGYTAKNTRVLCHRCNCIKNNATADELEQIAAYIRRETGASSER